MYRKLSALKKD